MKKYLPLILSLCCLVCFPVKADFTTSESKTNASCKRIVDISAKVLFYRTMEENIPDTCILVTSAEALTKYTQKGKNIDFLQNCVLVIQKPLSSTDHQVAFKDIKLADDELIIRYAHEVSNNEVEGPAIIMGVVIPKLDFPIKLIEHYILEREKKVETLINKDFGVE